jgi:hypothetical protein
MLATTSANTVHRISKNAPPSPGSPRQQPRARLTIRTWPGPTRMWPWPCRTAAWAAGNVEARTLTSKTSSTGWAAGTENWGQQVRPNRFRQLQLTRGNSKAGALGRSEREISPDAAPLLTKYGRGQAQARRPARPQRRICRERRRRVSAPRERNGEAVRVRGSKEGSHPGL